MAERELMHIRPCPKELHRAADEWEKDKATIKELKAKHVETIDGWDLPSAMNRLYEVDMTFRLGAELEAYKKHTNEFTTLPNNVYAPDNESWKTKAERLESKLKAIGELCDKPKCTKMIGWKHDETKLVYVVKRDELQALLTGEDDGRGTTT
jgi:hypothetical protein